MPCRLAPGSVGVQLQRRLSSLIAMGVLVESTGQSLTQLLPLMGWAWNSGDKGKGVALTSSAQGVELRLAEAVASGVLTVANAASSVERARAGKWGYLGVRFAEPGGGCRIAGQDPVR